MAEPPLDFQCYVGKYEIKRFDELPEKYRKWFNKPSNMPHLVQIGRASLRKPESRALDMAIGLLLKTQMPKWRASKRDDDLDTDRIRGSEPVDMDHEEFSKLEKNVLLISRHIGMLHWGSELPQTDFGPPNESLEGWIDLADHIRMMFFGREAHRQLAKDLERIVGRLSIFLSFKSGIASAQIRPVCTHDALVYRAAQMIAQGTTSQTCDKCGGPFLGGGERSARNKRREGARFCSDRCRWEYHNEVRRKKAKL